MDLSDFPAPSLSLTGVWLVIPDHAWGLPCCARFPCVHAVATTPAQRPGPASLTSPQSCQPSPIWQSGRPVHRHFRGLLGVHSRYGLHTRAVTVYRDTLTRGFSHFVTSMTAPVASGWSGCRAGLAPTGKRHLPTAHANSRPQQCDRSYDRNRLDYKQYGCQTPFHQCRQPPPPQWPRPPQWPPR